MQLDPVLQPGIIGTGCPHWFSQHLPNLGSLRRLNWSARSVTLRINTLPAQNDVAHPKSLAGDAESSAERT